MHAYLGKTVTVTVDRPLGACHPRYPGLVYPVNYGYLADVIGGDGEGQDAYILGVDHPVATFTGRVIAVIYRTDDVEEKWVVAPEGVDFTRGEIAAMTEFQEKYFKSVIEVFS